MRNIPEVIESAHQKCKYTLLIFHRGELTRAYLLQVDSRIHFPNYDCPLQDILGFWKLDFGLVSGSTLQALKACQDEWLGVESCILVLVLVQP